MAICIAVVAIIVLSVVVNYDNMLKRDLNCYKIKFEGEEGLMSQVWYFIKSYKLGSLMILFLFAFNSVVIPIKLWND
jgi:hypothetical protein